MEIELCTAQQREGVRTVKEDGLSDKALEKR